MKDKPLEALPMKTDVKKFVLTGLMTAMVFVLTFTLKVPVPYTSGYIHLGDSMIYLSVIVLGPVYGAFASGVGSMLADLLAGYVQYAIPTLIIKSLMALVMGLILKSGTKKSTLAAVGTSLSLWTLFSGGAILYLQNTLNTLGMSMVVESLIEGEATPDAIQEAEKLVNALPLKLVLGIGATLVIMSIAATLISKKTGHFTVKAIIGMTAAGMCMVMGYFLVESFMYSPIAATFSIPPNLLQFFGGVIAAGILAPAIKRASSLLEK